MARITVTSDIAGKVWKIEAAQGQAVGADDTLVILESMKMEIPVAAPQAGKVIELRVAEGESVAEGQAIAIMEA
ncbi:MAG: biotin/lipoyl-binding carrier protein [Alphaproteobacteria bacterium]|nr:biotin/lipoyl-binding carrier protein [Alphaproteobacteria bacterium]